MTVPRSPRTLSIAILLAAAAWLGLAARAAGPANWPGWRGPAGTGLATVEVPAGWDAGAARLWRTEIAGRGHSSPVIWGNRVFVTAALAGDEIPGASAVPHKLGGNDFVHPASLGANLEHTFSVICMDADTGRVLWSETAYRGRVYDDRHQRGSYASPTPVTDGEQVYVYFGSQGVYAYDFDGTLQWKVDLGGVATLGMGVGSSPVLFGDLLILVCDQDLGQESFMVGLNRIDGSEVWRAERPVQVSWSTPLIVSHRGASTLVVSGNEWIIGYDPASGRELWRLQGLASNAIASPLAYGDTVILSSGYPRKITKAVRLGGSGDVTETERLLWQYGKGTSYVGSYLLQNGRLYLFNDQGVMSCLDAATGEVLYEGGRPPKRASIFASPLGLGDSILMASAEGDLYFVKDGPAYEAVEAGSVGEPVMASPAVAAGRLYVRGDSSLMAFQLQADR